MSDERLQHRLDESCVGERLDRTLSARLDGITRSVVSQWVRDGRVRLDGTTITKPGFLLRSSGVIEIDLPAVVDPVPQPQQIDVPILHEDEALLVVNKPVGMVVHPGNGVPDQTLVNALLGRGTALARAGGNVSKAAKELDLSRATLHRKMKRLGLER